MFRVWPVWLVTTLAHTRFIQIWTNRQVDWIQWPIARIKWHFPFSFGESSVGPIHKTQWKPINSIPPLSNNPIQMPSFMRLSFYCNRFVENMMERRFLLDSSVFHFPSRWFYLIVVRRSFCSPRYAFVAVSKVWYMLMLWTVKPSQLVSLRPSVRQQP